MCVRVCLFVCYKNGVFMMGVFLAGSMGCFFSSMPSPSLLSSLPSFFSASSSFLASWVDRKEGRKEGRCMAFFFSFSSSSEKCV